MKPEQKDTKDYIVSLFTKCAKELGDAGPDAEPGKNCYADGQAYYSLYWYYKNCILDDLNENGPQFSPILSAYFFKNIQAVTNPKEPSKNKQNEIEKQINELFPQDDYKLNEDQINAALKAIYYPISIIKGPPGTGKTNTIMHIVALALNRGETVAVVSTNSYAVKNVEEKAYDSLKKYNNQVKNNAQRKGQIKRISQKDLAFSAALKLAALGNAEIRKSATDPLSNTRFGFDGGTHTFSNGDSITGWETAKTFSEFTKPHPFVTSTIHSLKKCFADGDKAKFDLLIMDEASQTNLITGVVALSCAKRVVLVGDENQLPPVITDEDAEKLSNIISSSKNVTKSSDTEAIQGIDLLQGHSPYNLSRKDFSFLESCDEVFANPQIKTFLRDHYRYHPAIIGFCNQFIYENKLNINTALEVGAPPVPIRIVWYEGDYREQVPRLLKQQKNYNPEQKCNPVEIKSTSVNRKQLSILREEESCRLLRYAKEGKSICILTPFNGQITLIRDFIYELLNGVIEKDAIAFGTLDGDDSSKTDKSKKKAKNDKEIIGALTIHKSQGQEFDIVYLLPVEDGNWEWPWSQGRRLVNVAASRAKKELVVIVSTKLMEPSTQKRLTGRIAKVVNPADEKDDLNNQHLYVRRLIEYTRSLIEDSKSNNLSLGEYGFHRTCLSSIFDEIPFLQNPANSKQASSPESCMIEAAQKISLPQLSCAHNVSFENIYIESTDSKSNRSNCLKYALSNLAQDFYSAPEEAHFDFVFFEKSTKRVIAAIEIDGAQHRFVKNRESLKQSNELDGKKDLIAREICHATLAWLGKIHDGSLERCKGTLDEWVFSPTEIPNNSSFVFLRIPSDGSTYWETDALRNREQKRQDANSRITTPPTIEDYLQAQLAIFKENKMNESISVDTPLRFFISDEIEECQQYLTISQCLKEWKDDPHLAPLIAGITSQNMNEHLIQAGYLCRKPYEKENQIDAISIAEETKAAEKTYCTPTKKGEKIGIREYQGINSKDNSAFRNSHYSQNAKAYLLKHLYEILGCQPKKQEAVNDPLAVLIFTQLFNQAELWPHVIIRYGRSQCGGRLSYNAYCFILLNPAKYIRIPRLDSAMSDKTKKVAKMRLLMLP